MIIYGEIEKTELYLDYKKLAEKMWFKSFNGKNLDVSHLGASLQLQTSFNITLGLPEWEYDERWRGKELTNESLNVQPINIPEMKMLIFSTTHKEIYTLDQRAFFIFIIEIMNQVGGRISIDNKKSWMSIEEFQQGYQDIINLTFPEANELSLAESQSMALEKENWMNNLTDYEKNFLVSFEDTRDKKCLRYIVKPNDLSGIIDRTELIDKMWPGISLDQVHVINDIDIPWVHEPFTLGFQNMTDNQGYQQIEGNFKIPKYNMIDTFGAEDDYVISVYTNHFEFSESDYHAFYTMLHEVIKLTNGQVAVNVEDKKYQWQSLAEFEAEFAGYLR